MPDPLSMHQEAVPSTYVRVKSRSHSFNQSSSKDARHQQKESHSETGAVTPPNGDVAKRPISSPVRGAGRTEGDETTSLDTEDIRRYGQTMNNR